MKTVLAVLGVLAVLAVIVIVGGGYFAYKKGTSALVEVSQQEVEKFISIKHPAAPVADSLHRLTNAAKLHQSWGSSMLVSVAISSIQDGAVTDEEVKMIDEAAQLTEQGDISKEQVGAFMKKYEPLMPRHAYQPSTVNPAK